MKRQLGAPSQADNPAGAPIKLDLLRSTPHAALAKVEWNHRLGGVVKRNHFAGLSCTLLLLGAAHSALGQPGASGSADAGATQPKTHWHYSEDKNSGGTERYAAVNSDNKLDFKFPYQGGSTGEILLHRYPDGLDGVLIGVTKGQILCPVGTGKFLVRFDDRPIQTFQCAQGSQSDRFTVVEPDKFIAGLKTARKTVVELEFFQEGDRQLIFNSAGLNWP